MTTGGKMIDLKEVMEPGDERIPILEHAWENMPEGFKTIIGREDPIVTVTAKAKEIAKEDKEFVRSDIGQAVGVIPEYEVYYGPTIGIIELRKLIAEFWTKFYKLDGLSYENVAITTGATEALGLLFAILSYGHKVILMTPHWPTFPDAIVRAGADYIRFELIDESGKLRLKELSELIETEQTHTMLINFPNNPSGIAISKNAMSEFASFAREHQLILISDEVYNRIRFTGEPQTMLSFAPERTVAVSAASKDYLIPGHRTGYVISMSKTITNVFMKKLIRCQSSCPGIAGQYALMEILSREVDELRKGKSPSFVKPVVEELKRRRDVLANYLQDAGFKLYGGRPSDGSIFMLAKIPEEIKLSDKEFISKAMEMKKFSAIPGSSCGEPGYLRFSFGSMEMADIERMGKRLKEVVESLKNTN
jgi:aspartate/methionine/tyrosine aminotransferase